ncbi:DNA-dependent protein kinase catalytic subunit-like [Sitophilus oryzae]|uniref:DNA-dependent protein kinase catalytic subunit-like n=1 Tax=Sitophilus oryzae TaxID=7048 RepID=A0A6J2Y4Q3_SITOR|nr:DNA-dependent protein kinase catalytic subunit-like [Sitophilus oryzae]
MDIEPHNFFQILKEHASDPFKGPSECERLLSILNYNLTEEQMNASLLDLYLVNMFSEDHGIFSFIQDVGTGCNFNKQIIKCLEIIYALINNFPSKIEKYVLGINKSCVKILLSKASAQVKAKAADVLLIGFEKIDKCLENQEEYLKMFNALSNLPQDHADIVKEKEYILKGMFAKRFSYLVHNPRNLKYAFINKLDSVMSKQPSQGLLTGLFVGLEHYCEGFPIQPENPEDKKIIKSLYEYIRSLSSPKCDRRTANRAALHFFGKHMDLFVSLVVKEFKSWHKRLYKDWLNMGKEEQRVAEFVLKKFFDSLAQHIVFMDETESLSILKHFIGWAKHLIRLPEPSGIDKRLTTQVLKYFCEPMYQLYASEEARQIFVMVMQNFEKNYIFNENVSREDLNILPDYIQCLSSFVRFQTFTTTEFHCLERAVINMIKSFHELQPLYHFVVIESVVNSLFYLRKTKLFDTFLENIIYQGVIWSCCHHHVADYELSTSTEKVITVKSYFPFWRGLLKVYSSSLTIDLNIKRHIQIKIVNELIKTMMLLVNKLNVNMKLKEDTIQTQIESAYNVEQENDFAIFLNVTDLYQEIFDHTDPQMFNKCIFKLINHLVGKCLQHSLISGFYKLLALMLKIANNVDLLNNIENQDAEICRETLSRFISVLLHKMKQFKDDLLISCLQVLLECPVVVVEPLLSECVGVFITVLEVGRSYILLANMGLNALERWQKVMDKDEFEAFLIQIVPHLDSFLRSKSLGGLSQIENKEKKRKTAQALQKRRVLLELEPELLKFQRRVLNFIGSQNSKICRAFVSPDNNIERKVTSEKMHLKVSLPYRDQTIDIYLEPFVMRVLELSLYCSDRKTRIMACELLQSFIMVFLGRTKPMNDAALSDLEDLWRSLCMPLLQLSCDVDQVVSQIFEPLFMQLIHWYTSKQQRETRHSAVIIDVIMEGITHPTNSALRDFSGRCLNEFIRWTIKHTSEREMENNPLYVKIVVKRMAFFSTHPDLVKKLGAAIMFNNIYREIREERSLISIFSIELLYIFVSSLSLIESVSEEVEPAVFQIKSAILHLKRIFIQKSRIFCGTCPDIRRVPSDIQNGDLVGVCQWLFKMTASKSHYCREISMELFTHFVPLCSTDQHSADFVQEHFPNAVTLYEQHLTKYPTLHNINVGEDSTVLLKWLQGYWCLLDGYTFLIKNSLYSVSLEDDKNVFFSATKFFLNHIMINSIDKVLEIVYKKHETTPYYTIENKQHFLSLKYACSLTILKLARAIADDTDLTSKSENFWINSFWNLILNFLFNPLKLGFEDNGIGLNYSEDLNILLNSISRKLANKKVKDLVEVLKDYVSENFSSEIDINRNISRMQRGIVTGLLMIKESQINNYFNSEAFSEGIVDKLMKNFYDRRENNVIFIGKLSDTALEFCSLLLDFALSNNGEFKAFLKHIFQGYTVSYTDLESEAEEGQIFGIYLLQKFQDVVVKYIFQNFALFLENYENFEYVVRITTFLISSLKKSRIGYERVINDVFSLILDKWIFFQIYFEENSIDAGLDFVKTLYDVFGTKLKGDSDVIKWTLNLVGRDQEVLSQFNKLSLYLNIFYIVAEVNADVEKTRNLLVQISAAAEESQFDNSLLAEKMMSVLPRTRNVTIYKSLIELHGTRTSDLTTLLKTFMSNNSEDSQETILQSTLELVTNQTDFDKKKQLLENIFVPVLRYCTYNAFKSFLKDNIVRVLDDLNDNKDYGKGIVGFALLELFFLKINMDSEESNEEALGITQLIRNLLKIALEAFKIVDEAADQEQLRLYKCSAYKALTSIVSNYMKKGAFYEKLFVRQEKDHDILWCSVINCDIEYNFTVDFDSYPEKRKVLVSIRDELRQQSNRSNSLKYIESQRLFNSSLSEDITKHDFSTSVLRSNANDSLEDPNASNQLIQGELYLESTEINNHELMGTVCGLIKNIFNTGVNRLPEDKEDFVEFPKWMEGIRNLLLHPSTPKNVKLFWIKVIDNTHYIFRHFAKYFMEPLMQFLVDKVAGDEINYFVSDVVILLAYWSSDVTLSDTESELATKVLEFLVEKLTNERQDAFKYNLDLIKLLVENWKGSFELPFDALSKKLDFDDRRVEVGLHLISIFLVNNYLPFKLSDLKIFWGKLLNILSKTFASTFKPCAEVLGLILKYLDAHGEDVTSLCTRLSKRIFAYEDNNKYVGCLECIAIHYPNVVNVDHLIKMFNQISHSNPQLQAGFLRVIHKRADQLGEYSDFKSEDWPRYLESQNPEVLLLSLEILLKTFHLLKGEIKILKKIMKCVSKNLLNPDVIPRVRMYDIMIAVYSNVDDEDINELCRETLLQGLSDPDIQVREKIRTYWCEQFSDSNKITEKFLQLVSKFYIPKAEEYFLGNVSYLLLNSLNEEGYESELFDNPLQDCDFEEYKLQTNWRLQHKSVVPLFAQTLKSYSEDANEPTASNFGQLRATQADLSFAPTQQVVWDNYISNVTSLTSSLGENNDRAFLNPNAVKLSDKYKLPKRRFIRDKSKISTDFANRAVKEQIRKTIKRTESVKERESRVTIYRSYRKGDLPDIQITLGSMIKPLQMLILHDGELSKQFFLVMFKVLMEKVEGNNRDFVDTLFNKIKYIFDNSTQLNANLFATLLDISLMSKDKFRLDPNSISTVCQQSGLISMGTLLLEEYLMDLDDCPSTSKRGVMVQDPETVHWIKLAELYKELQEWDLIKTIFIEKTNCKEEVQKALLLESEKKWRNAQESYSKLLQTDPSPDRQDFYFESCFKCLAHLGEWDKFSREIQSVIPEGNQDTWDVLWGRDWYQQKVLPWYITSQIKTALYTETSSTEFLTNINKSLANPEQSDYLKSKFAEELCILWIKQKDTDQAIQYQKSGLNNFLNDWQLLNPMFGTLRYNKILDLRSLVEIGRFLDVESKLADENGEENLNSLINYWRSTQGEYLPSIILSEAKLLYRRLFIEFLSNSVARLQSEEAEQSLKETKIFLDVAFMNVAIEEENYYMTRKYARLYTPDDSPDLKMIYGNLFYLYTNLIRNNPNLKVEKLLEALKLFKCIQTDENSERTVASTVKFFDISQKLSETLRESPDIYPEVKDSLSEVFVRQDLSPLETALDQLKTLTLDEKRKWNNTELEQVRKALVKLAYFVQNKDDQEYDFALYVLRAMRLGSKEARQLFPCILLKDSLADNLSDVFIKETKQIPTWMFLGWIPQLLANVDSDKVTAISDLVLRIAETYPQAIMYSYRLSKENYTNTDNLLKKQVTQLINRLNDVLLNNPVIDKFLTALSKVSVPFLVYNYYLKKMKLCTNIESIINIRDDLLKYKLSSEANSKDSDYMQGSMYKKNAKVFIDALQKINERQTLKQAKEILQKISFDGQGKVSLLLKDYCPWLANFSAARMNLELEIPGQYTGDKMPLVQHHIKIAGFRETVAVMSSKTKPIKITMLGMNSKEYPFLVKAGEDIRQDQRIEQLFVLMNNIFATANKTHQLLTYQVIPLTSSLGIIQWVENIISIEGFIKKSLNNKKRTDSWKTSANSYVHFFERKPSDIDVYGATALKRTKDDVVKFYQRMVNQIPLDILRSSIWSLCLTSENYIAFRNNFIKSYAVMSACNWILGIGDRHLENVHINMKNGMVLGIDFGLAFGTATQILPAPELVPFR